MGGRPARIRGAGNVAADRPLSAGASARARSETTLDHTNGSFVGIHRGRRVPWRGWWLAFAALCLAVTAARADGVHVALLPDTTMNVAPGDSLLIELYVTEAGDPFNAYETVIGYDTTALVFLPTSPTSLQEGSLMKGACGSTFHIFKAVADSLSISHSLLCAGISLTGPGQLYKLRFRAREVVAATWIRIRRIQFYDAGPPVNPAYPVDAFVVIGGAVDVPPAPGPAPRLSLAARPNPCRLGTTFVVASEREGEQRLQVYDVAGRAVRTLARGWFAAGPRRVAWDGTDSLGRRVPPGVYPVVFTAAGREARARVTVVR
jgi:hypothetical protein